MSSLEAQAAERKARLAALRNKNKPQTTAPTPSTSAQAQPIKSRNFNQEQREPVSGVSAPPTALDENSDTVEAVSQAIQDRVLAQFRAKADVGARSEVVKPRKITWDLERDLRDDMDLLEEKTDEIIKGIVKERIRKLQLEQDGEEEETL